MKRLTPQRPLCPVSWPRQALVGMVPAPPLNAAVPRPPRSRPGRAGRPGKDASRCLLRDTSASFPPPARVCATTRCSSRRVGSAAAPPCPRPPPTPLPPFRFQPSTLAPAGCTGRAAAVGAPPSPFSTPLRGVPWQRGHPRCGGGERVCLPAVGDGPCHTQAPWRQCSSRRRWARQRSALGRHGAAAGGGAWRWGGAGSAGSRGGKASAAAAPPCASHGWRGSG